MNKRRNRRDGELWWRLPVGMAGPRREDDTLVRAYPFAAWARFRLSKPKFPSCCIHRRRSCGVTARICFSYNRLDV